MVTTRRRYRDETLVLETEFETADGVVRVIDFMPPRGEAPDVIRIVEGVRGTVPMKLSEISDRAKDADVAANTYQAVRGTPAVAVPTVNAPARLGEAKVPDLAGFPLREAVKAATALGLVPTVEGSGRLSKQEPPAGSVLPKGSTIKLIFEPST